MFQAGRFESRRTQDNPRVNIAFTPIQYAAILLAVLLASRFVTEDSYMPFWTRVYHEQPKPIAADDTGPWVIQQAYVLGQTSPIVLANNRQALIDLSTRLTFRCWEPDYDAARPLVEGECFFDDDDWDCKRHSAIHVGSPRCGTCAYCIAGRDFRCLICNRTRYRRKSCTKAVLMRILTERHLAFDRNARKAQLVQQVETDDLTRFPVAAVHRTTNA